MKIIKSVLFIEELIEINALASKFQFYYVILGRPCIGTAYSRAREHSINGTVNNPIDTLKETKTTS